MKPFLDQDERIALELLKSHADPIIQRAAHLLILADQGISIRQLAARLNLSRSGVFYWVNRFRRLRLATFDLMLAEENHNQPVTNDDLSLDTETPNESSATDKAALEQELSWLPLPTLTSGVLLEDSFAEAGRKILLFHFAQMISHEAGTILGEDIEALHDMRVATRRMRAAFDLFANGYKPNKIKPMIKGLRITGRALGRVRDLDVFIDKVNSYLLNLPVEKQHGMDSLLHAWHAQRDKYRIAMIAHLESLAYQEFKRTYAIFLQTPGTGVKINPRKTGMATSDLHITQLEKIFQIVPLLIYSRLAAVTSYADILLTATIPQLHALRIEFKRLRYTLEFFVEILKPEAKMVINELKVIQDHLGDLHDADVACHNLSEIIIGWENQHNLIPIAERPDPGAVIAYLAYCSMERHRLLSSFHSAWENFNRPEVRYNLAMAIAAL